MEHGRGRCRGCRGPKDRAAKILSDARLNFSKLAKLIEQRRPLLWPSIVANIKKMDQPVMLSDPAFRAAAASLRREARAWSDRRSARTERRNRATIEDTALRSDVPYRSEPGAPLRRPGRLPCHDFLSPSTSDRFLPSPALGAAVQRLARSHRLGRRVSGYVGGVSAAVSRDAVTSSVSSTSRSDSRRIQGNRAAPTPPPPLRRPRPLPDVPSPLHRRSRRHAGARRAGLRHNDDRPPSKPQRKIAGQAAQRRTLEVPQNGCHRDPPNPSRPGRVWRHRRLLLGWWSLLTVPGTGVGATGHHWPIWRILHQTGSACSAPAPLSVDQSQALRFAGPFRSGSRYDG